MCCERPPFRATAAGRTALAALLALAAIAGGCGKAGDPEPPLRVIPRAAGDLTAQQRGLEVILRFGYPQVTTAGRTLPTVDRVEVWGLVRPLTEPPAADADQGEPQAPQPAVPPPLDPRELAGATSLQGALTGDEVTAAASGDQLVVRLPIQRPEGREGRWYTVRTGSGRELSAFSNQAVLVTTAPPEPPRGLRASAGGEGIELSWQAEATEAAAVEGFHVYRRNATARDFAEPVGFAGPDDRSLTDRGAGFGQRYVYAVTAVASRVPLVESAIAATTEVDYRDRFAPPPPGALVALSEPGRVRLLWDASNVPDVAGYHVYRRTGEAGEWRRLTDQPAATPEWTDGELPAAATVSYRVTAIDRLGNESEPGEPATAPVR
jgi:hypothetical protein